MRLSQKYLDFNSEFTNFDAYLTDNATRLEVATAQVTLVTATLTTWNTAFTQYVTPATHTSIAVEGMRRAFDTAYHLVLGLRQQVKHNRNITLSAADFSNLGIHIDKTTLTPSPIPSQTPINTLLATNHLVNTLSASMPKQGEQNHRGKPEHVHSIGQEIAVLDADIDPTPNDYHSIDSIGSTTFDISFNQSEVGKTCHLITWYINPRNESGPKSPALSFMII